MTCVSCASCRERRSPRIRVASWLSAAPMARTYPSFAPWALGLGGRVHEEHVEVSMTSLVSGPADRRPLLGFRGRVSPRHESVVGFEGLARALDDAREVA